MSLIWHGIWSGYIIIFLGTAVVDIIFKNLQKKAIAEKIYETVPRPIYLALWFPLFRFAVSFLCMPFHYQYFDKYNKVYQAFNYLPFIFFGLCTAAMFILPNKRKPIEDKVKQS